jgi:hypothetical protein
LLLSPAATLAWRAASPDNIYNDFGSRVIAAKMLVTDSNSGNVLRFFQISAYAPTSDSQEANIIHFEDALAKTISHCGLEDILVICMDANASIGCKHSDRSIDGANRIIGPCGISHINRVGQRLRTFLNIHNLVAFTPFFKKKHYGTWQHPRSKLQHQEDRIFVS